MLRKFFKRFGTDIAGYACLLLVLPVGSLPGPGGIPLLIAGLSLLSIHNPWAKSLLDYARNHSDSLRHIFFPKNKKIELLWDIAALLAFSSAFVISGFVEAKILKVGSTALGAAASTAFMMNRSRLDRILAYAKKKRRKEP